MRPGQIGHHKAKGNLNFTFMYESSVLITDLQKDSRE